MEELQEIENSEGLYSIKKVKIYEQYYMFDSGIYRIDYDLKKVKGWRKYNN